MDNQTKTNPTLFVGQTIKTKRHGGEIEGKIVDFFPNDKLVLIERMVRETFVTKEQNIIPVPTTGKLVNV